MEEHMPENKPQNRSATLWIILAVVVLAAVAFFMYFGDYGQNASTNEDDMMNSNATMSFKNDHNIILNPEYSITLEDDWQDIKSNITNDIYTAINIKGTNLKIIILEKVIADEYGTPAEYLKARSFEFSSTYEEIEPKEVVPSGFPIAKRMFAYDSKTLVAAAINLDGDMVLFEVAGPSSEDVESTVDHLITSINK